ncbi:hypothetical protein [Neobacillus fumarioli]|nr:hypothetical protein [Neobacillus fumarioli]
MIVEKFTPFARLGEETLQHLVDTFFGLLVPVAVNKINIIRNPGEDFE